MNSSPPQRTWPQRITPQTDRSVTAVDPAPPQSSPPLEKYPNPLLQKNTITKERTLFSHTLSLILKPLTGVIPPFAAQARHICLLHLNQEGNCVRQRNSGAIPRRRIDASPNSGKSLIFSVGVPFSDASMRRLGGGAGASACRPRRKSGRILPGKFA